MSRTITYCASTRRFTRITLWTALAVFATSGCADNSQKSKPVSKSPSSAESTTGKDQNDLTSSGKSKGTAAPAPKTDVTEVGNGAPPSTKGTVAEVAIADDTKPKKAAAAKSPAAKTPEIDDTPRKPATVEDARRALDLTKFPLPEGADAGGHVAIAHVGYKTAAPNVKSAVDYVRKQFTDMNWKEVGETYVSEAAASGTFAGKGFVVTVTVSKDSSETGAFSVSISNLGNVNLAKLPVPPNVKPQPSTLTSVGYFTEQSPDEAREAVDKLLTEQGWTPYGRNLGTKKYKQNAVELSANVFTMQAPDNRVMIWYSASQMSADLPAPPQATDVDYTDSMTPPKQLLFETAAKRDELYQFYRDTLAKDGWVPTTENPITDRYKAFMIFRNKAKDLMELETRVPEDGKIRGTLKHQTAAELAEIERLIEADRPRREAEAKKEREEREAKRAKLEQDRKDKEAAEKAKRRVVVAVPAGAKDLKFDADEIKFGVPPGKARAAAEAIAKQFRDAGWKPRGESKPDIVGTYHFEKDDQSIHIIYQDPGISPPEVRVTGFRVDFERAGDSKK